MAPVLRFIHVVVGVSLLGMGMSACGQGASPGGPAASGSAMPSASTSSAAARPSTTPITLTGTVEEGVEAGCVILRTTGASPQVYTLDQQSVKVQLGKQVTVQGFVDSGRMSICQQGPIFVIDQLLKSS